MAQGNGLQTLVEHFVSQLQSQITRQIEAELAERIDAFKSQLLGRAAPARAAAAPAIRAPAKRGPRAGYKAEEKPCPVCGTMNKARRFSYLCENHRTDENRAKFKGYKGGPAAPAAAKPAAAAKTAAAAPGRPAGKRGPGRPKGSKNKPKTASAS